MSDTALAGFSVLLHFVNTYIKYCPIKQIPYSLDISELMEDPRHLALHIIGRTKCTSNIHSFGGNGDEVESGWKTPSVLPIFTASKQVEMRLCKNQTNCWSRSSLKTVFNQGLAFFIFLPLLAFKGMIVILLTSYHYSNAPASLTKLTGGNWKDSPAFCISLLISILFWPAKLFRSEMKIRCNLEFGILQRKRRIILRTLFNLTCKRQSQEYQKEKGCHLIMVSINLSTGLL